MSLVQLFRIVWARRGIIILATLTALLATGVVGLVVPARYKADSRIMLDVVKPDPVTGEVIASQFARAYVATQTELIKDYRIAGKVADDIGWTSSPELAAIYAERSQTDSRDFRRWVAQRIIDGTDAKLIDATNIMEISFSAPEPEVAARIADAIRRAYVEQAIATKREDANDSAAWFRTQTEQIRAQLTAAEKRKSDFERANGIVLDEANVDQESRRLSAIASTSPTVAPGASVMVGGGSNPAAGQLAQFDAAIASAEKTLGPNNPELLAMRRQRAAVASTGGGGGGAVIQQGPTGPSLASQYGSQVQRVLASRGKVDEARKLSADVAVLREQYLKASTRTAELMQQGQSTESGLSLLGSATAPQKPIFPNWPLMIFGSLALGLMLGTLTALIIELIYPRVRGLEDLRIRSIPVLGVMGTTVVPNAGGQGWFRRLRNPPAESQYG